MIEYHKIKHSSGLTIILNSMPESSYVYSILGVKYGSCNNEFKKQEDLEFLSFPQGIAHFLEHKMFENEDGEDTFQKFSKIGALANAYTGFDRTCYLVSCYKNFNKSLEILLNYITHPYFTDENVEKEKDIIIQELKMCQDSPYWQGYFGILQGLYSKIPIYNDIGGTQDSVKQITKEHLYECYNAFYNLDNMVLSIAGNFKTQDVLQIVDKILFKQETPKIINKVYDEPQESKLDKQISELEIKIPLLYIGYKHKSASNLKDNYINSVKYCLANELIVGAASKLYGNLYYKGAINDPIEYEVNFGPGYIMSIFSVQTHQEEIVEKSLYDAIKNIQLEKFSENDFESVKKSFYGKYIMDQDSPGRMAENYMTAGLYNFDFNEYKDLILSTTKLEIENLIQNSYNLESSCVSIIKPKTK